jgi:hypothetical protein
MPLMFNFIKLAKLYFLVLRNIGFILYLWKDKQVIIFLFLFYRYNFFFY